MTDLHKALGLLDTKLATNEGHSIAIFDGLDLEYTTSGGKARVVPAVTMTSQVRMDVLSMSKTITAAGVVRQLLALGLTPAEKIGKHLPGWWTVNPVVAGLTFAHLLTHTGGMMGDQSTYEQVQAVCAAAPTGTVGKGKYQNLNYSILRVLLAQLDSPETLANFAKVPPFRAMLGLLTASIYLSNIQTHVLKPCGVTQATIDTTSPQSSAQAEWFLDNLGHLGDQHHPANSLLVCGADHWNMNVREYARFIANLAHGTLTPNPWPTMRDTRAPGAAAALPMYPNGDARLGVWRFQAPDGTGNFYGHNGGWSDAFTGWMHFPGGETISFFANSTNQGEEAEKMILDSFLGG